MEIVEINGLSEPTELAVVDENSRSMGSAVICSRCGARMRHQLRQVRTNGGKWIDSAWAVCSNSECDHEFEF